MKLIDLLVHVLPKRGGWPDGAYVCFVNHRENERAYFHAVNGRFVESEPVNTSGVDLKNGETQYVTREQYEAALAAAQQPVWNGEGLPPVGCECEIASSTQYLNISHPAGAIVKIYSHFTDDRGVELAAFVDAAGKVGGVCTSKCFRPIRSEADKKRDEIYLALAYYTNQADAADIYDAIAAGKIPYCHIE